MMVDWADELGLDIASLHLEAFWHPVAQWENDRIRQQGEDYWQWRRLENPEPPTPVAERESKHRRYKFTDRQLQIAMRSVNAGL